MPEPQSQDQTPADRPASDQAETSPIAWFAAMLRGLETGNFRLATDAKERLFGLGWIVTRRRPRRPKGGAR